MMLAAEDFRAACSADDEDAVFRAFSRLLDPLFHRRDGEVAIEDRDTRVSFVWDSVAKRDIKLATAAMLDVGGSLHLVTDGTVFRWDAATQRWHAARK
jgi:hypothetical protein